MQIKEHVPLAPYTTFQIGGSARFFVVAQTLTDIKEALFFAQGNKVPVFIIGGGSNLLIADRGFDGLVIKIELKGITEEFFAPDQVRIIASAGEVWDTFVEYTVEKELYGLENLSGIPGTVGASAVQNIGAYGAEAKDTIEWVEAFDPYDQTLKKFTRTDCQFSYRDSYFKQAGKHMLVTRISYILSKAPKLSVKYKDVELYFLEKKIPVTLSNVRQAVIAIRNDKLPNIKKLGTAGSFFKNPVISIEAYHALGRQYPNMPAFPEVDRKVKISAAWLLDKVGGFKGFTRGSVGVYDRHALVLVNFGRGTAREVVELAQEMITVVKVKTGIVLEREVEYMGSF